MERPDLEIHSRGKAVKRIRQGQTYDAIISICDPPEDDEQRDYQAELRAYLGKAGQHLLALNFEDRGEGPNCMDILAIRDLAKACHERGDKRIMIHCEGGLNRSPAVGIVFLREWGLSDEDCWSVVMGLVPKAKPSQRVLELGGIEGK